MGSGRPLVKFLALKDFCILRQLKLEEALLRGTSSNWCVVGDGAARPTVVMGISGKPEVMVNRDAVRQRNVPVLRRFSGGGTVVVDKDTLFSSLIFSMDAVPGVQPFPGPLMQWSERVFKSVFREEPTFALRENDYVFGGHKFGGNAQTISKNRFLHHTSFLWDFDDRNMDLLQHPPKAPKYRDGRPHTDFLCRLRSRYPDRGFFKSRLRGALEDAGYDVEDVTLEEAEAAPTQPTLCGTSEVAV